MAKKKVRSEEYDRYNIYDDGSEISETEDDFNDAVQRADEIHERENCKIYVYDTYANQVVYETPDAN